ncbi:cytochrome c maturation protein CcmE [Novosphingobium sp. KCTC 2891]|uniref:cytochrome c maturation protein CcmE n=1 Tax=Novosphingobium sp. KCTC 2891 TaxID=2989730 RepID=UPI002222900D|nr:cytochrome c maturation protein CcmE [Novosphingobium sp. KCTC 2891]MCW1382807.1 cytochrome c maturation protein CcmE [Novosphingobium sp. KCTC 2891]
MSAIKAKHQRLVLLVIALLALIGAGLLAAYALKNQAAYFYVPNDLVANPPEQGRAIRLGGMVEKGSIKKAADGVTVHFIVGDGKARIPVRFTGITPDLFVEGSGVVAEGRMEGQTFVADNLLAKHDEKYVPREMKDMTAAQAKQVVAETK